MYELKSYKLSIFIFMFSFKLGFNQDLTTRVNFEKFYHMEEELVAISDLILKQEKLNHNDSDIHGLFNLSTTIERVKTMHGNVTSTYRLSDYFSHPLNLFHLTKRLTYEWKGVADILMESAACVKTMRVKLQNFDDQMPTEKQFFDVTYKIMGLQLYQKRSISDIMKGTILDMQPEETMKLSDAFDFGRAAYEKEDYYNAIDWFEYVNEKCLENKQNVKIQGFNRTNVLSKLASAYFKNGWIEKALRTTDELLTLEPNNKMAKRNRDYFESKVSSVKAKPAERPRPPKKFDYYYQQLCRGDITKNASLASRLSCLYLPRRNMTIYERPDVKAEVFNRKPLIVRFQNLLSKSIAKAIQYLGYDDMIWYMSKVIYREPKDNVLIKDQTYHKWVSRTKRIFSNVKLSDGETYGFDIFIQNIGLNGFQTVKKKYLKEHNHRPLGTMIAFLSDSSLGGELVFPMSKTNIPVSMGDVVFYEEGAQMALCPVMYGPQWYGTAEIFEVRKPYQCFLERRVPIL